MRKTFLIGSMCLMVFCASGEESVNELRDLFARRVGAASAAQELAMHRLGRQYVEALEQTLQQVQREAMLAEAAAILAELERFQVDRTVGEPLSDVQALRNMQTRYLDAAFVLQRDRAREVVRITLRMDEALERMERDYTSANRIEDAIAIRREREALKESEDFKALRVVAVREGRFVPATAVEGSWHVVMPTSFASRADAEGNIGRDGAIFVTGPRARDAYTVVTESPLPRVVAVRLEALPEARLPRNGPGRSNNGNFVLNRFRLFHLTASGETTEVPISSAQASFSQANYPVEGALDRRPRVGWAISPRSGQTHTAVFILEEPLKVSPGDRLRVQLDHLYHDGTHALGHFRLGVSEVKPESP